jgi:hypothetical protein
MYLFCFYLFRKVHLMYQIEKQKFTNFEIPEISRIFVP